MEHQESLTIFEWFIHSGPIYMLSYVLIVAGSFFGATKLIVNKIKGEALFLRQSTLIPIPALIGITGVCYWFVQMGINPPCLVTSDSLFRSVGEAFLLPLTGCVASMILYAIAWLPIRSNPSQK